MSEVTQTQQPQPQRPGPMEAVQDAHGHLMRARGRVEELRTSVRSASRVAEDIAQAVEQAHGRDHGDDDPGRVAVQLAAVAEDLPRLHARCELAEEVVEALRGDLDQASEAITRARHLATGEQRDRLVPRLDALEDAIDATRPIAEAAAYHLHCAGDTSADVDPARIARPQQLEHRLATADRRLERVDEDVRFLDLATGRATSAASRSTAAVADPEGSEAVAIDGISAAAQRRLGREQFAATSPSPTAGDLPDLGRAGPTR
ncbi:hypothetical protein [Nocardioides marmoraquaticus]